MSAIHPASDHHHQSFGEELANSLSHGIGLLLAIVVGLPMLVANAIRSDSPATIAGASIFGASIILLYLASTLYHAIPHARAKQILRRIDHGAIYVLIAGTYTPIALGVLRGGWGWTLLAVVWALALAGVIFKVVAGTRFHRLSTGLYLAMGWLALVAIRPLWLNMAPAGLALLLAGGLAYTVGVAFYVSKRLRYAHFIWHLFVLAGTGCHYFAVLGYAS